jgi:glycerophosphoryl diester phosphodiesterase
VYTLNDEDWWRDAVRLGVDGIITDQPVDVERWMRGATS